MKMILFASSESVTVALLSDDDSDSNADDDDASSTLSRTGRSGHEGCIESSDGSVILLAGKGRNTGKRECRGRGTVMAGTREHVGVGVGV